MQHEKVQPWVKILAPVFLGIFGTMMGGAVTWGITSSRLIHLEKEDAKLDNRIVQIEENELLWVEKFATLETKIDILIIGKFK